MRRYLGALLSILTLLGFVYAGTESSAATGRYDGFRHGSPSGSGSIMEGTVLPARIGRVAVVPGSGGAQAWAAGRSVAPIEGWSAIPAGQLVFLHYSEGNWIITGPPEPRTLDGEPYNPALSDMSITSSGDGWAVGENGTILHKPPGSDTWSRDDAASNITSALLQSVSVATVGGQTVGYAVGKPSIDPSGTGTTSVTILRYTTEQGWGLEPGTTEMLADGNPGFIGVATVSADEAWAVSDIGSNGVKLYHRVNGAWQKVRTPNIFEGPPQGPPFPVLGPSGIGYNRSARGSAIAASKSRVWVGGAINPSDAASEAVSDEEAEDSRPFMLSINVSSGDVTGMTSYCPDQYRLRRGGVAGETLPNTTALCDQPFPTTGFDISSISMISDAEVFAGGQGLFHFKGDGWFREQNAVSYITSLSMGSSAEGWAASGGSSQGRGILMRAISPLVGHFTSRAQRSGIARWSQNQSKVLEAVATSADGSQSIAVGQSGSVVTFTRQLGWDTGPFPDTNSAFHAVAWPGQYPWIVGDNGDIRQLVKGAWVSDPASSRITRSDLFGLAFRSPNDGVAVGANGTIVRYSNGKWRLDSRLTDKTLYAVTTTRDGYVAVGQNGTVIEYAGGDWSARPEVAATLQRGPLEAPHLYAAATGPSGKVYIGGARSALFAATPGNRFEPIKETIDGMVAALAAGKAPDGSDRLFASVSPDTRKYDGTTPALMRGTVLMLSRGSWRDIWRVRRSTASPVSDSSSFDDPVLSLTTRDGATGWGVGGTSAGIQIERHLRSDPSSSVYKLDVNSDPAQLFKEADVTFPSGLNFAVFGESWCGSGLCSDSSGTGTMADLVALRIRDEINKAYQLPNGPKFVLFTGNMRQTGLPEELASFKGYLRGFKPPVFAALGDKDLFTGINTNLTPGNSSSIDNGGSNEYWKQAFSDMPRPWGESPARTGIRDLGSDVSGARTHYAFDYLQDGAPRMRVILLDSSNRSLSGSQNPPEPQGQVAWFDNLARDAQMNLGIPTVVAMNQPTVVPDSFQTPNWTSVQGSTDKPLFEASAAANGVSAIFTGGPRMNTTDSLPRFGPVTVPVFVVGGGGGPLGFERLTQYQDPPTKLPSDGFYHAWHYVNVNPSARNPLTGQAPVNLKTFPVLDSLAMHSVDGEGVGAGNVMRFSALARQLSGGWSDSYQSKATYIPMGASNGIVCPFKYGQGGIYCQSPNALRPPYRFYTDDPSTAAFVLPDFGRGGTAPAIIPRLGGMQFDLAGQWGLLCAFKPGRVGVIVESGFMVRRMVITIGPGTGPCINKVFYPPPEPEIGAIRPAVAPDPSVPIPGRTFFHFQPPLDVMALVLPPAPGPIVAPAPPVSAAAGKKEEEEHQTQAEGQEDDAKFTVMSTNRARTQDRSLAMLYVASLMTLGLFGAIAAASARTRTRQKYVELRIWF